MGSVLVLGNAGADLVMAVTRLPLPGETRMATDVSRAPGGKGLNQAVVAARSGAETRFMAAIGDDPDGRLIAEKLADEPFVARLLIRLPHPTDFSVVMVSDDAENSIVTAGVCADALDETSAVAFAGSATAGDVLLLQGNLSLSVTLAAAKAGALKRALVVLNPAPLRWPVADVLAHCTAVVANQIEAAEITGLAGPARAAAALRAFGPRLAVVTLGAVGCVYEDESGTHAVPPLPARAVDTTGAGDTFCGMLAVGLARGWSAARCIDAAQRAAAITVSRPGAYAALPRAEELPRD